MPTTHLQPLASGPKHGPLPVREKAAKNARGLTLRQGLRADRFHRVMAAARTEGRLLTGVWVAAGGIGLVFMLLTTLFSRMEGAGRPAVLTMLLPLLLVPLALGTTIGLAVAHGRAYQRRHKLQRELIEVEELE